MLPQEPPGSQGTRACHASLEHIWMLVGDRQTPPPHLPPPPPPAHPTLTGSGISETLLQALEVNR